MNGDSYKVIISISHHRIAFEYWQRDGEDKLVPMPGNKWPAPLAFYCSQTGIEIGETAIRAVHANIADAFDNYFQRLTTDETYLYGGRRKPLRYLLLDATETILSDFFKDVLFGSKGTLSDNRATMPLTLVCEPDILPHERALLISIFKDSGYNRFKAVEYNSFIERYIRTSLAVEYACSNTLVAWTEGADLTFTLYDHTRIHEYNHVTFPNLGIDPRLIHVKQLIWDRIKGQNPWLTFSKEEESIGKAAEDFLNSNAPLLNDTIILSDGIEYHYNLNRTIINHLQTDEGNLIRKKLEDFLEKNNISNLDNTLLLLRGVAAGNIFFEQALCPGFRNIVRSDKKLRENTMRLLIADPNPINPQEPEYEPANIHIPPTKPTSPDPLVFPPDPPLRKTDEVVIRGLKREWREVKAVANGKDRQGNKAAAIEILKRFLGKISDKQDLQELQNSVKTELEALSSLTEVTPPSPEPPLTGRKQRNTQYRPEPKEKLKSDGEVFIEQGKLKEARDWYRNNGNTAKAKVLTDIIRDRKGVELRKDSLEEYKKTKNTDQIRRIISELQDYINLCNSIEFNAQEYVKLLNEYRKIIK